MVLVDTSIWIAVFSRRESLDLESLVDFDEIVTCLPVIQEVLQGFRDEGAFTRARQAMLSLPIVEAPLSQEAFLEAAGLYRLARGTGRTARSSVDCVIAVCALRNGLEVLHRDRDFPALARVSALRERSA